MIFRSNLGFVPLLLTILVLGSDAGAQSRSDTGRHQKEPPAPPAQDKQEAARATKGAVERDWTVSGSVGVLGAGRAFQVETVDDVSVPWDFGGGPAFQASRFNATFDQNVSFGLQVDKGMGPYWGLGLSLGYSRMNLGAETLVGQQGTVVLLDRIDVLMVGVGGQVNFTRAPSHPYFIAEVVMTNLGAGTISELDQTTFGLRLGLGYRQVLSERWAGKVQARLSRTGFSTGGFVPTSPQLNPSEIEFESEDHLTFFEIMLSLEFH